MKKGRELDPPILLWRKAGVNRRAHSLTPPALLRALDGMSIQPSLVPEKPPQGYVTKKTKPPSGVEYDRPTALPCWVGWAQFPVPTTLSLSRDTATKLARKLIPALRVNSGTGEQKES
jgi:hypothetical protein